ncbi:natriuretic peptides A-like [Hemicordylus capensis]|uniref:natriuretic peptides A-like n=1 Tax=Hemicordylus capensis TaxID=884348 RepID=UPI00230447C2|nr:natriuretic peptides A-like [Hemicordylus capensis]
MGSILPLLLLILFFASQLHDRVDAHPVYDSELGDFKALLERLEDKLEQEERESGPSQSFNEGNEEEGGEASQTLASWDGGYGRPPSEGALGRGSWQPPEGAQAAAKRRLGALFHSPRSRLSNCFGQRLDRLGSSSGLGCNRNRN